MQDTSLVDQPGGLRLQIPEPPSRPGEAPSFASLRISPAGEVRRPSISASSDEMADLRDALIGVLDEDGRAVGPWAGSMSADDAARGLRDMLLVRAFDARMLRAHRQGKVSFYMQSLGEEAIACAHHRALRAGDMNFPTYRQQGLLIASGYPLTLMMNQVLSNRGDPLRGRQLPVMYSSREHGFFSLSGNLATQYVQAVGWAMASAISGSIGIASAWIGEGASAESDFHAAMLFAATYQAPVILNIVNNQWAISTHEGIARGASTTFAARGLGYGIPSLRVDGNDYLAVHAASEWASERARSNGGPTLIEWVTLRVGAHSTSDDPSGYRPKDDAAAFPLGDPIDRLRGHLTALGTWNDSIHAGAVADADNQIAQAFAEAERLGSVLSGEVSSPSSMFDDVYATPPRHIREQRQLAGY